ncbi:MAG: hypothetical protein ABI925_10705 [Verrucomicrobiota bacterium]
MHASIPLVVTDEIDFLDRDALPCRSVARPGERNQRTFIKLALGGLIGFVLLIFLIWGGYHLYTVVESRHLARRAAAYLSGGDLKQSALSARRALQMDPSCVAAVRILAEVAERANDRSAMGWRSKAIELEPRSIADMLAFVNCLVQFNDVATAEKMLRTLDEKTQQMAEFHAAAGRLAEAKKNMSEAELHWAEAVKLEPENKSYQLKLGLVLLRIDNGAKRESGLVILEKLRSDDKQRAEATRALILDGVAHRMSGTKLAEMARELQGYPEATFSDRLLYLDFLRQLRDPLFTARLTEIEKEAANHPANLAALISWMNANGMSLLAIDFTHTLSLDVATKWPAPMAIAEAYGKLGDWQELERLLKSKDWGEFDFLRHAYLARGLREGGRPVLAEREWALAQKGTADQAQLLSVLSRTISGWGWERESADLLWLLSKHPETQWEALQALYQWYASSGDTPGLYRVLTRLNELAPADRRLQNNLAQLRLLLNADVDRARKVAAEIYAKEPSNPSYASTYAFALYIKGDADEGLRIMNGFTESQLRDPSLAAYYGILLAAAGEKEKARKYLTVAASGKLLPEEKALVAKAEGSLK